MRWFIPSTARRVVLGLLVIVGGCTSGYQADEVSAKTHSAVDEIGNATAAALLQSSVLLVNPDLQEQLQQLADELTAAAGDGAPCRVHVINNPAVNALSLPNGEIFVFTGLLDTCADRAELAFVLGHEIAHIRAGHALESMRQTLYTARMGSNLTIIAASMVGSAAGAAVSATMRGPSGPISQRVYDATVVRAVSSMAAQMAARVPVMIGEYAICAAMASYSRANEFEADRLGMTYAVHAGYAPAAATRIMQRLAAVRTREEK